MYKLFLCLTYLRRRGMAYFAMLAVALCVAMLIIAINVMNGFLLQIEVAAKGLFGDIVINAPGQGGLSHYDEFITEVKTLEEVEGATPFILAYGILTVRGTSHSQAITIAGIRLPERAGATSFEDGLFVQGGIADPTFDPPIADVIARLVEENDSDAAIVVREEKRIEELREGLGDVSGRALRVLEAQIETKGSLLRHLRQASRRRKDALARLRKAQPFQETLRKLQQQIDAIVPPAWTTRPCRPNSRGKSPHSGTSS